MVVAVAREDADKAVAALAGEAYVVGEVIARTDAETEFIS
jgi:phosphoribosylaminoimidazole (AIR) synthetase